MSKPSPITIISGQFKGIKLLSPDSLLTHPMGNREKNALFNMCDPRGARVLDLYAGSGALGLEALSRGAASVTFVEKSPKIAAILRQNLAKTPPAPHQIIISTTSSFLQNYHGSPFSLIIADPPYDDYRPDDLTPIANLLAPAGIFVLSSPSAIAPPTFPHLAQLSTHTYAAARLTVYQELASISNNAPVS